MKINDWLLEATEVLSSADIGTARLDALVLLCDALMCDKSFILAHPEHKLTATQIKKLNTKIATRATHHPLAYVRNKVEFYGREFYVDASVLVPRPETETMIDLLKQIDLGTKATIADIGTGSGAIAITVALELPHTKIVATDIDPECLSVAQKNSAAHGTATIEFLEGNLLEPLTATNCKLTAILANLPYVPTTHQINEAAMIEPKQAIFGGDDGLDLYREMFAQLSHLSKQPQYIFTESLPPQHPALSEIATRHGYTELKEDDFIQVFEFRSTHEPTRAAVESSKQEHRI